MNTAGSVTVGCFDYEGTVALLVVNNSVSDGTAVALNFDNTYSYEVIQNVVSSEIDGSTVCLQLAQANVR